MNKYYIAFFVALILGLYSCENKSSKAQIKTEETIIAISKGKGHSSYTAYLDWMHSLDSTITIIDLYYLTKDSLEIVLNSAQGLILSGGADINPDYYIPEGDLSLCGTIDHHRDSIEFYALDYAINNKLPILGICRGLQLINVHQKGNLYIDIPNEIPNDVSHRFEGKDNCMHFIQNTEDNILREICGVSSGKVNSSHHQGILKLGNQLIPLARSQDSLIEAITWNKDINHPFMLAVQWHPERMKKENPYSAPIGIAFLNAINERKEK